MVAFSSTLVRTQRIWTRSKFYASRSVLILVPPSISTLSTPSNATLADSHHQNILLTCPRLVVARHLHSKLQSYPRRWITSRASPLGRGRCLSAIERKVTMKISLGRSDCRLLKFDNRFAESADSAGVTNVNTGWFRWCNKRWPRSEG